MPPYSWLPTSADHALAADGALGGQPFATSTLWEPAEAISRPARLDVTISVRFTPEEISGVRERARDAGMRPTAFIRQAALDVDVPLNRGLLAKTFDRLRSDVEQLASVISIERVHDAGPRSDTSTTPGRPSSKRTTTREQPSVRARTTSKRAGNSDAAKRAP